MSMGEGRKKEDALSVFGDNKTHGHGDRAKTKKGGWVSWRWLTLVPD